MTKKRKRAGQKGGHSYSTCRWCGDSVRNGVRFKAHVAACLWATKRQVKQQTPKGSKQPASTIRLGQFLSLPASKKIKVFLFALCPQHNKQHGRLSANENPLLLFVAFFIRT